MLFSSIISNQIIYGLIKTQMPPFYGAFTQENILPSFITDHAVHAQSCNKFEKSAVCWNLELSVCEDDAVSLFVDFG